MDKNAIKIALNVLRQQESEVEGTIKGLQDQLNGIRLSIESLLGKIGGEEKVYEKVEESHTDIVEGDTNISMVRKTLTHHQRFMTNREISSYIAYVLSKDQKLWSGKVSRAVHKMKGEITSFQVTPTKKGYVWGFEKWVSDGEIIDKYMYDEKAFK